jgi:hypothetical protein
MSSVPGAWENAQKQLRQGVGLPGGVGPPHHDRIRHPLTIEFEPYCAGIGLARPLLYSSA